MWLCRVEATKKSSHLENHGTQRCGHLAWADADTAVLGPLTSSLAVPCYGQIGRTGVGYQEVLSVFKTKQNRCPINNLGVEKSNTALFEILWVCVSVNHTYMKGLKWRRGA